MRLRHMVPALCSGLALLACGFADLFSSRQVGNVVVTYAGPTTLNVSDRLPFSVSVTIGGTVIANPRVAVSSSDPSILTLSANGDTLVALDRGWDTLTIKVVASIYTDSFPTLRQQIRVLP